MLLYRSTLLWHTWGPWSSTVSWYWRGKFSFKSSTGRHTRKTPWSTSWSFTISPPWASQAWYTPYIHVYKQYIYIHSSQDYHIYYFKGYLNTYILYILYIHTYIHTYIDAYYIDAYILHTYIHTCIQKTYTHSSLKYSVQCPCTYFNSDSRPSIPHGGLEPTQRHSLCNWRQRHQGLTRRAIILFQF